MAVPRQHGAWVYIAVPLLLGLLLAGWSSRGGVFAITWIAGYPASYYLSRAAVTRLRRGSWTSKARRQALLAAPWLILAGCGATYLVATLPWLFVVGLVLVAAWLAGTALAYHGRERGFTNDLLLLGQALVALPLAWMITTDTAALGSVPAAVWLATTVCAVYFVGSVIHVKSLIREADDRRWRWADIAFHVCALGMAAWSWWLIIPYSAALLRTLSLRPGNRPATIGAVEAGVSLLLLVCIALACGPTPV